MSAESEERLPVDTVVTPSASRDASAANDGNADTDPSSKIPVDGVSNDPEVPALAETVDRKVEDPVPKSDEAAASTKREDAASTKREDAGSTKGEDAASTKGEDAASTKREESTKGEDAGSTKREDAGSTKGEDAGSTKGENAESVTDAGAARLEDIIGSPVPGTVRGPKETAADYLWVFLSRSRYRISLTALLQNIS